MILDIITLIRNMVKMVNPLAVFECDQARMLNVKVDTMERFVTDSDGNQTSSDFVYVEEPTTGYYDTPYRGYPTQRTIMQVYFCKFEPMANDAYKGDTKFSKNSPTIGRLELKNQIEEQMVRPFLYLLKNSQLVKQYPDIMNTVRVLYPSARFDANEVSVGLEFTFKQDWCLDAYKDKIWRPLLEVVKPGFDLSGHTIFFDRQDLPVPVYPPELNQVVYTGNEFPALVYTIADTFEYVAIPFYTESGGIDFIPAWDKDGWKLSSYTYPSHFPTIVTRMDLDDIPEPYWSLKHCYIK
jgi:hypothetical protein